MDNTSKKQFNYLNNYQPNTSSHNGNILLNNGFNNNNANSYTASGFSNSKTFSNQHYVIPPSQNITFTNPHSINSESNNLYRNNNAIGVNSMISSNFEDSNSIYSFKSHNDYIPTQNKNNNVGSNPTNIYDNISNTYTTNINPTNNIINPININNSTIGYASNSYNQNIIPNGNTNRVDTPNIPYYNKDFQNYNNFSSIIPTNTDTTINSKDPTTMKNYSNPPTNNYSYNFDKIDFDKFLLHDKYPKLINPSNFDVNKNLQNLNINNDLKGLSSNNLGSTNINKNLDYSTQINLKENDNNIQNNFPLIHQIHNNSNNIANINFESKEKHNGEKIKKFALNDYLILKTLGKGAFGRVRIGMSKLTGTSIAIKSLKKKEIIEKKQGDHILNEIKILNLLDHPFSVKFDGFSQDPRFIYLGLELINGGELFTYIRTNTKLPVDQSRFYISHIVLLLEYIHSKNIAYRDLKPENILIDKYGYLKLTDMGLAKIVDNRTYTFCGTPEYMAPEIVTNKGYGKYVDWWATGILLYELLVGIDPFNDPSGDTMKIFNNILNKNIAFPRDFDGDAKSLIKHLCDKDLTKRYGNLKNGVSDIKNHKFFKNFNFADLINRKIRPAYIPPIKGDSDSSQFMEYPDSVSLPAPLDRSEDIFAKWFD